MERKRVFFTAILSPFLPHSYIENIFTIQMRNDFNEKKVERCFCCGLEEGSSKTKFCPWKEKKRGIRKWKEFKWGSIIITIKVKCHKRRGIFLCMKRRRISIYHGVLKRNLNRKMREHPSNFLRKSTFYFLT